MDLEVHEALSSECYNLFCTDCEGMKPIPKKHHDERQHYKCIVCGCDVSSPKCLKAKEYKRICAAVGEINQAIGERGCFPYED